MMPNTIQNVKQFYHIACYMQYKRGGGAGWSVSVSAKFHS